MMKHWTELNITKDDLNIYPVGRKGVKDLMDYAYECDDIFTCDTENSTGWLDDEGNIIKYHRCMTDDYWNSLTPVCVNYIWMFSFNDIIYYGRYAFELKAMLDRFPDDVHIIIYVHNLAYDYASVLKNIYPSFRVFARQPHKPVYVVPESNPNIEFRCSYFLTRMSLATWGKKVGIKKRYGDLDYEVLRTPLTELTEEELGYCEFDLRIMIAGLKKYRAKYSHVKDIPITQTGEVRREMKNRLVVSEKVDWYDAASETYKKKTVRSSKYKKLAVRLLPIDFSDYEFIKRIQAGGYTHGNCIKLNRTIERSEAMAARKDLKPYDPVGMHWDVCSLYPFVLCAKKYPMNIFEDVDPEDFDPDSFEDYAWKIHIRMDNLRGSRYNHFISAHKSIDTIRETTPAGRKIVKHVQHYENMIVDNGRVVSADYLEAWIDEQTYMTIKESYEFDETILECKKSKKQYLPKPIIEYILELYGNKTKLKGVKGSEDLYNESKQFVNSISGLMQTDIVMDNVVEDENDHWRTDHLAPEDIDDFLLNLVNDNKGRTFVSFDWGVWCTAYGRREIARRMMCLDKPSWSVHAVDRNGNPVAPNDAKAFDINGVCYVDTDSIFSDLYYDYKSFDIEARWELEAMCDYYGLDRNLTYPKDPKGKERQLGEFTEESRWTEFRTLHAKCYCVREVEDGELHLTVSGVNKEGVYCLHDDIENFRDGFQFDKDAVYEEDIYDGDELIHKKGDYVLTTKQLVYITNQKPVVWNKGQYDEYKSDQVYGVAMRQSGYKLSNTLNPLDLINMEDVGGFLRCVAQ